MSSAVGISGQEWSPWPQKVNRTFWEPGRECQLHLGVGKRLQHTSGLQMRKEADLGEGGEKKEDMEPTKGIWNIREWHKEGLVADMGSHEVVG